MLMLPRRRIAPRAHAVSPRVPKYRRGEVAQTQIQRQDFHPAYLRLEADETGNILGRVRLSAAH
jgi:hypothetical protein